jgi:hypothetical protein
MTRPHRGTTADENILLERLGAFREVGGGDTTNERPIERVLRGLWRTLDHLKSERVRRDYTGVHLQRGLHGRVQTHRAVEGTRPSVERRARALRLSGGRQAAASPMARARC